MASEPEPTAIVPDLSPDRRNRVLTILPPYVLQRLGWVTCGCGARATALRGRGFGRNRKRARPFGGDPHRGDEQRRRTEDGSGTQWQIGRVQGAPLLQPDIQRGGCRVVAPRVVAAGVLGTAQ